MFPTVIATIALMLAACGQDAGEPGTDGNGAATDGGDTALSCEQAFAQIDTDDAMEAVEQSGDALDDTIEACNSVEEWVDAAGAALGITEADSLAFVEGRCRANPELAHVGPCAGFSSPEPTAS